MKTLTTSLLFILSLTLGTSVWSQSLVNNPCAYPAGAQITLNAPCASVNTFGMTPLFNPGSCNSGAFDDGWAWFQGDGNTATITYAATAGDPVLHVFSDPTQGCLVTEVGCADATFNNGTEVVVIPTILGSWYLIRIQNWGSNGTTSGCLDVSTTPPPPPADYTHPTTGVNNEKVGACLVNDCGPFTYADDGDTGGNYSNNIPGVYSPNNAPYRVFCPSVAGNCMQVTFNSFNTAGIQDVMYVRNGPTEFSPNFTGAPTNTTSWPSPPNPASFDDGLYGNLNGVVPFSFTSTDASGCLTFAFLSNGTIASAGWEATLQCIPCVSGPTGLDNNDCVTMTPICSAATIPGNSTGPGLLAEGCNLGACPAGGENHTNWYTFTVATSGTFNFTINPITNSDDYDYTVFGPNVTCGALGAPIRCSDAGTSGNTGLQNVSPNENTEDVLGDGWTETMNVVAGDSYIIVVDEWSANAGSGYDLSFGGTASLDCTILPIELTEFNVEYLPEVDEVALNWITASERDNDRFEVERSTDGVNFEVIRTVKGAGTTNYETQYYVIDAEPFVGVNYYRLNQFDIDGNSEYSEVRTVNILDDFYDMLSLFPNPTTGKTEVIFNSYSKGEAFLNVIGADGKVIVNTSVDVERGGNKLNLDLSEQQRGVYIVSITTRDKTYKSRLVKK